MGFFERVQSVFSTGRRGLRVILAMAAIKRAERLSRKGRHPEAAEILEAHVGLGRGDYSSSEKIARSLHSLTEFNLNLGLAFGLQLAILLGMAERTRDELSLRESLLGVDPADYADRLRLHQRLAVRPADLDPELWGLQIYMLAATLGKLSRRAETIALVEAALEINPSDYAAPGVIRDKVQTLLGPAPAELVEGFLMVPALAAMYLGRRGEAAALLEACLGLAPDDYEDHASLAAKLREGTLGRAPELVLYPIMVLVGLLILLRREADAVALLVADLGLNPTVEAEPREVVLRFQQRAMDMSPEFSGFYLLNVAYVMTRAGHPRAGVAVLDADPELAALDWNKVPELSVVLARRLAPLFPSARSAYVMAFAEALSQAGREDLAALLVDGFLQGFFLTEDEAPFMAYTFSVVAANWLHWWWQDASRSPLEICRFLVRFLCDSVAEQGVTLRDREDFIRAVSELRRRVVQTGLYWAAQEPESEKAGTLRRTVILWDLELSQRLIVERFRLTEIRPVPAGEPLPSGLWPLPEAPLSEEAYLPDPGAAASSVGVLSVW